MPFLQNRALQKLFLKNYRAMFCFCYGETIAEAQTKLVQTVLHTEGLKYCLINRDKFLRSNVKEK